MVASVTTYCTNANKNTCKRHVTRKLGGTWYELMSLLHFTFAKYLLVTTQATAEKNRRVCTCYIVVV